jgi:hypothetical protein
MEHRHLCLRPPTVVFFATAVLVLSACTSGASSSSTSSTAPAAAAAVTSSLEGSSTASPTASPEAGAAEQFTPIVMKVMTTPQWFTGSDGKVHLTYELEMTNSFPVPTTVTQVIALDADSGAGIHTLTGDQLSEAMSLLVPQTEKVTELPPATVGVVWMDVVLDDPSQLPTNIEHELTINVPPGLPVPETLGYRGGAADVSSDPPTVLGPPLTGAGWYAAGSCCDGAHRRTVQPINNNLWVAQRFAIDFNKADESDMVVDGDASLNESWFTYDQPVLAVADAAVTIAVDGNADQIPNAPEPVDIESANGNHIILEVADGKYAFYAHLKSGSVTVKTGDTVTKGQVIGHTGNSGSSTGPHLHFQMMDRPSALMADGRPYVFDQFTVTGKGPTIDTLLTLNPETDPLPIDTANAGPRTDELPLSSDVVVFAEG